MQKTILITGSTDGIGLETAKMLALQGHKVLLHGRNYEKLEATKKLISKLSNKSTYGYLADMSSLDNVKLLAKSVVEDQPKLDVLINNAGIYKVTDPITQKGFDIRFIVNTVAPYLLTKQLLTLIEPSGRVINVSSAAQSPVEIRAITGQVNLSDSAAYAQSKLALTMWSYAFANFLQGSGPAIIAVNPGSLLASKMVKQAYGISGADISIGAKILVEASLADKFINASCKYFDNDSGRFSSPHPDALNLQKCEEVIHSIEKVINM